jgi:hypothetical protein
MSFQSNLGKVFICISLLITASSLIIFLMKLHQFIWKEYKVELSLVRGKREQSRIFV